MARWCSKVIRPGPARPVMAALLAFALAMALAPTLATAASAARKPKARGWAVTTLPLPAGAAINSFYPVAVSCPSRTRCTGGGSYYDSPANSQEPALLSWTGKKWTAAKAPLPAGAQSQQEGFTVAGVACPSATACFAGGSYRSVPGNNTAMLLTLSKGKWSAAAAPLPAGANPNPDALVSGISCRSATHCTAAGTYSAGNAAYGLLLTLSGKKWTPAAAPVPVNSKPIANLNAVACSAVTRCFAGGAQEDAVGKLQPLMLTGAGSKWTPVTVPLPAGAAAEPQAEINGLACPSVTHCVAVGVYQDTAGNQQAVLLTWDGKKWTAIRAPLPAGAGSNPWADLHAVSCPSVTHCTAGGDYENAASQPRGLVLSWGGKRWAATTAPTVAYSLRGLSCPAVTRCVAVSWAISKPVVLAGP